jgi:hypothetical protein
MLDRRYRNIKTALLYDCLNETRTLSTGTNFTFYTSLDLVGEVGYRDEFVLPSLQVGQFGRSLSSGSSFSFLWPYNSALCKVLLLIWSFVSQPTRKNTGIKILPSEITHMSKCLFAPYTSLMPIIELIKVKFPSDSKIPTEIERQDILDILVFWCRILVITSASEGYNSVNILKMALVFPIKTFITICHTTLYHILATSTLLSALFD